MILFMYGWADGDLATEFERGLDGLLAELCPEWRAPDLLEPYDRRNAKRMRVGQLVGARPHLAPRVLAVVACDEDVSLNKQLIRPLLEAVGRRTVQRHLISVIDTGPAHKKVCAVRAWYWSQVTLVYESVQALREHRPTRASRAADDNVADLRGHYRIACLCAFVTCEHAPTREWLARGFLLRERYYPPNLHDVVAEARAIAEADRDRYANLLGREDDGTTLGQIGPDRT